MANASIHLVPLSDGNADPGAGAESAEAQLVIQRIAANGRDRKRQQDVNLRYGTIEANVGSSNAGITDPRKFPKRKKDR